MVLNTAFLCSAGMKSTNVAMANRASYMEAADGVGSEILVSI